MKKQKKYKISLVLIAIITIALVTLASGKTIYVDDDAPVSSVEDRNGGANNGTSWTDAYVFLQDALVEAETADKPVEIRVAQGVYKPNQGVNIRQVIFFLINEVTLAGGYAGLGELDPNERNFELYETILSGDLAGNDVDVNNPSDLLSEPTRSDNGPIIYSGYSINKTAVLDGFVITGGRNTAVPFELIVGGGGIKIDNGSSPTISNCTFIGNAALACGGGMLTKKNSSPIVTNCKFIRNYAWGSGGGVYNASSNPIFSDCLFEGNYAGTRGGGMGNFSELFWGLEQNCKPVIINCIFSDNFSESNGGGVSFNENCNLIIFNCSFIKNFGNNGRALSSDSLHRKNNIKLTNCILWNGGNEISNDDSSIITITYSNIQGGWEGNGNIDEDPLFVNPGCWADVNDPNIVVEPNDPNAVWVDGDYHLKSEYGRWTSTSSIESDPNSGSWVADDVTSPCIDAGDPNMPVGDEPFPNGGIINMGAYGGTSEASKSYIDESLIVDVNDSDNDGQVVLEQDQILVVTLESNPSTGYRWEVVETQDSILEQIGKAEYQPSEPSDPPIVGAGGWEIFRFKAVSAGQETVQLVYRRSWETDMEPIDTFSIDVIVTDQPEPSPLIAHWALDELEGDIAYDSTGNNDATVREPQWTEGKINGALQFNGFNTSMDCGGSELLRPEQMTLCLWIEPHHMGGMRYIVSRAIPSTENIDYTITRELTGEIEFAIGQPASDPVSVMSQAVTALNEWSHLAVCLDGSQATIYINGQSDSTANYTPAEAGEGQNLVIGSHQASTRFFNGKMDDIRIYNQLLGPEDIAALAE